MPESTDSPAELTDRLEPAPSGRAGCRACGAKIAKGEWRFGEVLPSSFGEGDGTAAFWFHLRCAAQRRPEKFARLLRENTDAQGLPERERLQAEAEQGLAFPKLARVAGAERASSGRARCRQCQQLIPDGAWRLRLSSFGETGFFDPLGFIHAGCARAYLETDAPLADRLQVATPELDEGALKQITEQVAAGAAAPGVGFVIAGTCLPVAANLHFLFTEVPFLDRFAAAARAGFRAVEFPDAYDHPPALLAGLLAQHGLTCALVNFPMGDRQGGELGFACHPGRREEFQTSVPLAIATALALGCGQLNCMAGYAPPGADPTELRATLIENLRLAAGEAARAGLHVLLEPLNTHDRPGLFVQGSAQAMAILDHVAADNLRLQFDCYHLRRMGEDLLPILGALLPRVGHVQVADVPGRHQPGTGDIPYPEIFSLLEARQYRGWIGAEYHPAGRTEDSLGWLRR